MITSKTTTETHIRHKNIYYSTRPFYVRVVIGARTQRVLKRKAWILGCKRNHWAHTHSARSIPMLRHEAGILPCSFTKDAWAITSSLESWSHIIPNGPNVKVQQIPPPKSIGNSKMQYQGPGMGHSEIPRLVPQTWAHMLAVTLGFIFLWEVAQLYIQWTSWNQVGSQLCKEAGNMLETIFLNFSLDLQHILKKTSAWQILSMNWQIAI